MAHYCQGKELPRNVALGRNVTPKATAVPGHPRCVTDQPGPQPGLTTRHSSCPQAQADRVDPVRGDQMGPVTSKASPLRRLVSGGMGRMGRSISGTSVWSCFHRGVGSGTLHYGSRLCRCLRLPSFFHVRFSFPSNVGQVPRVLLGLDPRVSGPFFCALCLRPSRGHLPRGQVLRTPHRFCGSCWRPLFPTKASPPNLTE